MKANPTMFVDPLTVAGVGYVSPGVLEPMFRKISVSFSRPIRKKFKIKIVSVRTPVGNDCLSA